MQTENKLTPEQIKSVKGSGFLHNRGTRNFNARIITGNGVITSEELKVISEAAQKFGNGTVTFTVRLTVEVSGIVYENIEPFRDFIAQAGLKTGGTGKRVRPVVACKGTTCVYGLCDTQGLAAEIHQRFYEGYYDVTLPHKFKIAVGGCPNNCAKPDLNDLGIIGQRVPEFETDKCRGCKKCVIEAACPMGALTTVEGMIKYDMTKCNNCGRCVNKCPFKVNNKSIDMFKVYIGGKWGKKVRMGSPLSRLFTKDEILDVVEKAILLFKSEGRQGERFGETVDRLGVEKAEEMLVSDNLLINKEKIVAGDK